MDLGSKVILLMVLKMEKVCSNGVMDRFMMVNGEMVRNMVVVCGKVSKVIHI